MPASARHAANLFDADLTRDFGSLDGPFGAIADDNESGADWLAYPLGPNMLVLRQHFHIPSRV